MPQIATTTERIIHGVHDQAISEAVPFATAGAAGGAGAATEQQLDKIISSKDAVSIGSSCYDFCGIWIKLFTGTLCTDSEPICNGLCTHCLALN